MIFNLDQILHVSTSYLVSLYTIFIGFNKLFDQAQQGVQTQRMA